MKIQPKQIKQIQTIMSHRVFGRDERLDFISAFLGREITTTKELSAIEADDLIYFLNTGKKSGTNWAFFDKDKFISERKLLFSYMHQAQWTVASEKYNEVPDLERLSNFLKSPKSPVQKPLKEWKKADWEKILTAFLNIVKFQHK